MLDGHNLYLFTDFEINDEIRIAFQIAEARTIQMLRPKAGMGHDLFQRSVEFIQESVCRGNASLKVPAIRAIDFTCSSRIEFNFQLIRPCSPTTAAELPTKGSSASFLQGCRLLAV
jgi:hypothetical protein